MKLAGRVALVTGASRGVGQAIALELARRGAHMVLAARTVDQAVPGMPGTLSETAGAVRALGGEAHVVAADLTDTEAVERLAEQALAWRGRVDVLVNNAAFLGRAAYHSLDEMSLKNFGRQLTVNVTAPFVLSKALVPAMREAGGGAIVNVTSGAGIIGAYSTPGIAYGSTKAALNRLTTLLARDLRSDGIAVFAVDPGYTRTVLVDQTAEQVGLDASTAHAPEVPAGVVADLVEADASATTGRVFKAVEGKRPVLMADGWAPMPEGVEVDTADRVGFETPVEPAR
jgi:NAD(P)-dependent dehydrogenase (short-subunit alcohol dehydrogenase family)